MQYQVKGILTIVVLTALAGLATAKTIEERLVDCTGLDDQQRRLACFDELAIDVSSTSASGNVPGQGFGLEHKDIKKDLPEAQQGIVREVRKNAYGAKVLILDSGQVWEQKDARKITIHSGDTVLIERGSMSAFYLTTKGDKRIRVARIR